MIPLNWKWYDKLDTKIREKGDSLCVEEVMIANLK